MNDTLPFPTTPQNTTNHPKNRYSRERTHCFHSLLGKREGCEHLLMCDSAYTEALHPHRPRRLDQRHKFDNTYVFGELDYINKLRNRIAHHEPICFSKNPVSIDTKYIHNRYNRIMELFRWMDIDGASLLYGLGHIDNACNQIDALLK